MNQNQSQSRGASEILEEHLPNSAAAANALWEHTLTEGKVDSKKTEEVASAIQQNFITKPTNLKCLGSICQILSIKEKAAKSSNFRRELLNDCQNAYKESPEKGAVMVPFLAELCKHGLLAKMVVINGIVQPRMQAGFPTPEDVILAEKLLAEFGPLLGTPDEKTLVNLFFGKVRIAAGALAEVGIRMQVLNDLDRLSRTFGWTSPQDAPPRGEGGAGGNGSTDATSYVEAGQKDSTGTFPNNAAKCLKTKIIEVQRITPQDEQQRTTLDREDNGKRDADKGINEFNNDPGIEVLPLNHQERGQPHRIDHKEKGRFSVPSDTARAKDDSNKTKSTHNEPESKPEAWSRGAAKGTIRPHYKTELCRYWLKDGRCFFRNCGFAHGEEEFRSTVAHSSSVAPPTLADMKGNRQDFGTVAALALGDSSPKEAAESGDRALLGGFTPTRGKFKDAMKMTQLLGTLMCSGPGSSKGFGAGRGKPLVHSLEVASVSSQQEAEKEKVHSLEVASVSSQQEAEKEKRPASGPRPPPSAALSSGAATRRL